MGSFSNWMLNEFPLNHYGHQFSDPNPGNQSSTVNTFIDRDRLSILHPKTFQTLEGVLGRSGHNFNILLVEGYVPQAVGVTHDYQSIFNERVWKYIKANGLTLDNHITFAKNGSSGDALTPWMILHTMGHAIFAEEHHGNNYDAVANVLRELAHKIKEFGTEPDENTYYTDVLQRFFSFKSARNQINPTSKLQKINNEMGELIYELFAEYLWNAGHIRIGHSDRTQPLTYGKSARNDVIYMWRSPLTISNTVLAQYGKKLEQAISNVLQSVVGEIVSDFYIG